MKSLKDCVAESLNENQEVNEGIIEIGATIWALKQVIGLGLLGLTATGAAIASLYAANKERRECKKEIKELNDLLTPYKDQLLDPNKCPELCEFVNSNYKKMPHAVQIDEEIERVLPKDVYKKVEWSLMHRLRAIQDEHIHKAMRG